MVYIYAHIYLSYIALLKYIYVHFLCLYTLDQTLIFSLMLFKVLHHLKPTHLVKYFAIRMRMSRNMFNLFSPLLIR
jgi:hypothetical protein